MSDLYLTADAAQPLITYASLKVEANLYNLSAEALNRVIEQFGFICNKSLAGLSNISTLSGGEKVLLMILLALNCPAPKIKFCGIWHALDTVKRKQVQDLLSQSSKDIVFEDQANAD